MLSEFKKYKANKNLLSEKKSEKIMKRQLIKTKIYFKKNLENK